MHSSVCFSTEEDCKSYYKELYNLAIPSLDSKISELDNVIEKLKKERQALFFESSNKKKILENL